MVNKIGKAIIAMGAVVLTAVIVVVLRKLFDSQLLTISEENVKCQDDLALADIVAYFKGLDLDRNVDTPFVSTDLSKCKITLPEGVAPGNLALLLGVFENGTEQVKDCCVVYSKSYDEALQNLLAKAQDGVVVLE